MITNHKNKYTYAENYEIHDNKILALMFHENTLGAWPSCGFQRLATDSLQCVTDHSHDSVSFIRETIVLDRTINCDKTSLIMVLKITCAIEMDLNLLAFPHKMLCIFYL